MSVPRTIPGAPLPRIGLLLVASLLAVHAQAGPKENARAANASRVLNEIQAIPEQAIPDKLLDEARAVVVIPDTLKVGLVIGGRRGHGLMSVKLADGTWSQPAFVKLTGGSIGLQAGVQSSDVVLVFRSDRNLNNIVNGKFTLGADAGIAAGPVGRNASALTDGQLKAEIWSWSRARGLFAGVALDGAVLQIDDDANMAVYGGRATPRAIFESRVAAPSEAVVGFRDLLEEATDQARFSRGGSSAKSNAPATSPPQAPALPEPAQAQPLVPNGEPGAQGFEAVGEGEIRSEALDGTP